MKTFGEKVLRFYSSLELDFPRPPHVELLLPFGNPESFSLAKSFFQKFYNDDKKRTYILGINPGRFGAGLTGVPFTDPVRLEKECGIKNELPKKPELSSLFVYEMIRAFGGVDLFYEKFYLTAVCPVGFVSNGKNINYYDDKKLLGWSRPFIIETLKQQIRFGALKNTAVCLGEGKNYKFLLSLNDEHKFFSEIIPLAHPRFIMQYKRKELKSYINLYVKTLTGSLLKNEDR